MVGLARSDRGRVLRREPGVRRIYYVIGGIGGTDGGFVDALSFSVQTMSTIGYGVMHPDSGGATTMMIIESLVGILITALATGLVFAKFSRPTTRVAFSETPWSSRLTRARRR